MCSCVHTVLPGSAQFVRHLPSARIQVPEIGNRNDKERIICSLRTLMMSKIEILRPHADHYPPPPSHIFLGLPTCK